MKRTVYIVQLLNEAICPRHDVILQCQKGLIIQIINYLIDHYSSARALVFFLPFAHFVYLYTFPSAAHKLVSSVTQLYCTALARFLER